MFRQIARLLVISVAACVLGGCAWLDRQAGYELHATGGIVGHYADYVLPAPNKEMVVYRSLVVVALFSRVASSVKHDDADAMALYFSMKATVEDMNKLLGHLERRKLKDGCAFDPAQPNSCYDTIEPCTVAIATSCTNHIYYEAFESELPSLEGAMFRLVTASVPHGSAGKVVGAATSGDYLGAALSLAQTTGELLLAAHDAASVYRSEEEVYAAILEANKTAALKSCNVNATYRPNTVAQAVAHIREFDSCLAKTSPPDIPDFKVPGSAYDALFSLVRASCVSILRPVSSRGEADCRKLAYAPVIERPEYSGEIK